MGDPTISLSLRVVQVAELRCGRSPDEADWTWQLLAAAPCVIDNALPWKSREERDKATAGARWYAVVSAVRGALRRVPARGTSTKHESPTHHSQHSVVATPRLWGARACRSSHSMGPGGRSAHYLRGRPRERRLDGPIERDRSTGEVVLVVAPIGASGLDYGIGDPCHLGRDGGVGFAPLIGAVRRGHSVRTCRGRCSRGVGRRHGRQTRTHSAGAHCRAWRVARARGRSRTDSSPGRGRRI